MKRSTRLFLVIDQSTSATKVLLVTVRGEIIDQQSIPHRQIYPKAGWVEHDPEEIFTNTIKAIDIILQRHNDVRNEICAFSITNQRETFVVFNRESGSPLYNAIVWQCQRGDAFCKQLVSSGKEEFIHQTTGLKIDTYFPASKIRCLLDVRPDIESGLKDGSVLFGTMDTFLVYRLTKGKVYATDYTNASRTLFFDIGKLSWSEELCEVFGLDFFELPDVRESSACFGETDIHGLLDFEIPICGVIGDSQAALFAQRCFIPGSAKVTFGTGSSILLNIGNRLQLSDQGNLTALAWVLNGEPTYAYEGIVNFSGATIAWLQDQLQIIADPAETETLARSVTDSDGVYFIPAFSGLSAPYWRSDIRAAILGITLSTTRAHIVRAALESIGFIVTDALKAMTKESNLQLSTIYADGGATKNLFLMQFFSDLNQITIKSASTAELSAFGAFLQGMLGLNFISSFDELKKIPNNYKEYNPLINQTRANQLLTSWQAAVRQLLTPTIKRID